MTLQALAISFGRTCTSSPVPAKGGRSGRSPSSMFETNHTTMCLFRMLLSSAAAAAPHAGEARRRDFVDGHVRRVEAVLARCHPVIPIQRITVMMVRILVRKVGFVSRLQWRAAAPATRKTRAVRKPISGREEICAITELIRLACAPEKKPKSTAKAMAAPSPLPGVHSASTRIPAA